jgi:hypothetical protein
MNSIILIILCLQISIVVADQRWLRSTSMTGPTVRNGQTNHMWKDTLFVLGGDPNDQSQKDLMWSYNRTSTVWSQMVFTGYVPVPRVKHAAAMWNDNLFVFGGENLKGYTNDLWHFNLTSQTWDVIVNATTSFSSPGNRFGTSMYLSNFSQNSNGTLSGIIYLYGGYDENNGAVNELWTYSLTTKKFKQIINTLPERYSASICCGSNNPTGFYIMGGFDVNLQPLNDVWFYAFPTINQTYPIWTRLNSFPTTMSTRASGCLVDNGINVYFYGGHQTDTQMWTSTVPFTSPGNFTWKSLSVSSSISQPPALSYSGCAINTYNVGVDNEDDIFIFGGQTESTSINSLFEFQKITLGIDNPVINEFVMPNSNVLYASNMSWNEIKNIYIMYIIAWCVMFGIMCLLIPFKRYMKKLDFFITDVSRDLHCKPFATDKYATSTKVVINKDRSGLRGWFTLILILSWFILAVLLVHLYVMNNIQVNQSLNSGYLRPITGGHLQWLLEVMPVNLCNYPVKWSTTGLNVDNNITRTQTIINSTCVFNLECQHCWLKSPQPQLQITIGEGTNLYATSANWKFSIYSVLPSVDSVLSQNYQQSSKNVIRGPTNIQIDAKPTNYINQWDQQTIGYEALFINQDVTTVTSDNFYTYNSLSFNLVIFQAADNYKIIEETSQQTLLGFIGQFFALSSALLAVIAVISRTVHTVTSKDGSKIMPFTFDDEDIQNIPQDNFVLIKMPSTEIQKELKKSVEMAQSSISKQIEGYPQSENRDERLNINSTDIFHRRNKSVPILGELKRVKIAK